MKKILFLFASAISLNVSAQTSIQLTNRTNSASPVALQPNATVYVVTVPEDVVKTTIDIKNVSASVQSYKVIRYDKLLHAGAEYTAAAFYCIAGTCFAADTDTSNSTLVLKPNESASDLVGTFQMLEADLSEIQTKGLSIVKYTFFNINNPADSAQITIQYNGNIPTGIARSQQTIVSDLKLYPNPNTNGVVTVDPSSAHNKVEIYNMLGSLVLKHENTSVGVYQLNVAALPAGTYLVKVSGDHNTVTEKLIISK